MSSSKYGRIVKILEDANEPLTSREIADRDCRLGYREVGLTIHHNNSGEIKIIKGEVRRYQLTQEVMA